MATAMTAVSSQVPWATAAMMPRVMPRMAASDERRQGELDGAGQHFQDAVEHRPLAAQADAQVAAQGMAGVIQVLHDQRPVEAVLVAELGRALGRERLVASEELDGITRDQVEQQEAEDRDAEQHGDRLHQALEDVGGHERSFRSSNKLVRSFHGSRKPAGLRQLYRLVTRSPPIHHAFLSFTSFSQKYDASASRISP